MKQWLFGGAIASITTIIGYQFPGAMPILVGMMWGMIAATLTSEGQVQEYIKQEMVEAANELQKES